MANVGPSQGAHFRSPEQVRIDAEAAHLRGQRLSYKRIGEIMGCDASTARDRVLRSYRDTLTEPAAEARQYERERLDALWVHAENIANTKHFVTAHGKVVKDDFGDPVIDDAPVIAARREQRMIAESYRKLDGLDAPAKIEQSGGIRYEIVGVPDGDL